MARSMVTQHISHIVQGRIIVLLIREHDGCSLFPVFFPDRKEFFFEFVIDRGYGIIDRIPEFIKAYGYTFRLVNNY